MPKQEHLDRGAVPPTLQVPPLAAATLIMNVSLFRDEEDVNELDTDHTYSQLVKAINNTAFGRIKVGVVESALYFANLANESEEFIHPLNWDFKKFLWELLPADLDFDLYYNLIIPKEEK